MRSDGFSIPYFIFLPTFMSGEPTKKYGDREVVKNISFTAKDGAITGFIGHNGAGKSTTIKAITGIIQPTEGTITINGMI